MQDFHNLFAFKLVQITLGEINIFIKCISTNYMYHLPRKYFIQKYVTELHIMYCTRICKYKSI